LELRKLVEESASPVGAFGATVSGAESCRSTTGLLDALVRDLGRSPTVISSVPVSYVTKGVRSYHVPPGAR
jgi:hypothetical protein